MHPAVSGTWNGVTSVVDVGAGAGALLASIVAGNPGVRGILFDRPDVLPDADYLLTGRGVREHCMSVPTGRSWRKASCAFVRAKYRASANPSAKCTENPAFPSQALIMDVTG